MGDAAASTSLLSQELANKSNELQKLVEKSPAFFKPLSGIEVTKDMESKARLAIQAQAERKARQIKDEINRQELKLQKLQKSSQDEFEALNSKLVNLDELAIKQLKKIEDEYDAATTVLQSKKKEVDDILGLVSGNAIAGDYEKSALAEKQMAELLRIVSLFFMLSIAVLLGYTSWETTKDTFSWDKSAFRILVAAFLSAPAAYLARESSKHRQQQYAHLQTSLDLKALSPFVATLPDEMQHKIKAEVASRVFSGRDFSRVGEDSYPVNVQEILLKIIEKLDPSKSDKKT